MTKTPIKVRVKLAFGNYRVGDILEPAALYRDELLARGFVEVVKAAPETAQAPAPETAARPAARRKAVR